MQVETIAGTNVLHERNHSQIINIQIWTDIGSSNEQKEEYGVAHFLEHMLFKGTEKRSSKRINLDSDLMGAKLNAWTWHDHTNYHINVMKENAEKGFELLSDIYLNSIFPEDEMEKERSVILSEMRRNDDDPSSFLADRALDHFCQNGLAHRVIGTEDSIKALTRSRLMEFKKSHYGTDHILISFTGDISFAKAARLVEKYFHHVSCPKSPHPFQPSLYRSGNLTLKKGDIQESQYLLLYPALPHLHPQAAIQGIMSMVLGGNASSLLFERVREELGLCYGIASRIYRFKGFNYLDVETSCAKDDLEHIHQEITSIIEKIKTQKITEERVQMIKASMLSNLYMGIESSSGLNHFLAMAYMKGERDNILQKRITEIKSATAERIRKIAEETFNTEPLRAQLIPLASE
ncbi:MAG: insulinase family protein [Candidatus Aureabacteria bacterium]|nr:insulinase family protein [Candidatus Auribacterota bacterium]